MAEKNLDRQQRGIDPIGLLAGLIVLAVSGYVLTDGLFGLSTLTDPRWLLAAGAVFVGVLMLGATLRPGRRRNR